MVDDFTAELIKDFLEEAFDLMDKLEESLLSLEKNPNEDKAINEVFRIAHTIKGGAGSVGFTDIKELTHVMEDVLDLVRKKQLYLKNDDITLLLKCKDELNKMLACREREEEYSSDYSHELVNQLTILKNSASSGEAPNPTTSSPTQTQTEQAKPKVETSHSEKKTEVSQPIANIVLSEDEKKLTSYDLASISDALHNNKRVFFVRYVFNDKYEMKDVSAFQTYALINDISEVLKVIPPLEEQESNFSKNALFVVAIDKDKDGETIKNKTYLSESIESITYEEIKEDKIKLLEKNISDGLLKNSGAQEVKKEEPQKAQEVKKEEVVQQEVKAQPQMQTAKKEDTSKQQQKQQQQSSDDIQKRAVTTLRVESWKVDELLNLLGELVITKTVFSQMSTEFDKYFSDIKIALKDFLSGLIKLNLVADEETNNERNNLLRSALTELFLNIDIYTETVQKLNRISSSLQENVMNMRMVPVQMVFSKFPRLIRDTADKLNKKVEFILEGVETEIDKGIVDDLFDPLIHILRNAVDHGIELPHERVAAGKPEVGTVILRAAHEGDSIVIEVADDGKGIDVEAVKRKAVENNFITQEMADKMSNKDAFSLIFLPGLSTAKKITDVSGRGVGMDVVKRKIEEIGGQVTINSTYGKGTKLTIRLPLTLAIIQGLLIVVNDMHYVIPVASVEDTVIINMHDLKIINNKLMLELRGKFIPIMSLKKFFYGEDIDTTQNTKEYCIVCRYGENLVGILVSEVIGEQDIVIKPLNTKLLKSPGISAATIVGNGKIGYIMDTTQIISQYYKNTMED